MTSLRKDQSGKVSRLVAGGSAEEDRKADNQEHPPELSWPATVAKFIRDLCGNDHALVSLQSFAMSDQRLSAATYDCGATIGCECGDLCCSTLKTILGEQSRQISTQSSSSDLLAHVHEHSYGIVLV